MDDFLSNPVARESASRDPSDPLEEMFLLHHEKAIVKGGDELSRDATKLSGDHTQPIRIEDLERTSRPCERGDESLRIENGDDAPKVLMANNRISSSDTHA